MRDRALTRYQVASLLNLHPSTVGDSRWQRRVGLESIRIGRSLRFMESDVMRLIEQGRKQDRERR